MHYVVVTCGGFAVAATNWVSIQAGIETTWSLRLAQLACLKLSNNAAQCEKSAAGDPDLANAQPASVGWRR